MNMMKLLRPAQCAVKRFALVVAALIFAQPATQAATVVKTATGTDLTAGANWIGGVAPGSSDTATWTSTNSLGAGLTLGTSQFWNSINVVNASTDIAITGAGTLTLSSGTGIDMSSALVSLSLGNPIVLGANSTWNVGLAKTLTASGVVSESGGVRTLTKSGISTLKLTNANSFSGTTTISTGVLNIQNAAALGTTANLTTVSSGGTLELQGGITVTAKTLSLNGAGAFSGGGSAGESPTDATRNARAYGGALRNVSGDNTFSGAITLAADSRINSIAGTLTLNSGTAMGGAYNLSVGGPGNTTISSAIGSGAGKTLTKDGAGTLTLNSSAVNTFTGGVILNNGTLLADFAGVGATANLINSGNELKMGGGTLIIKAKDSSTTASQTLGNVTTTPLVGSTGGGGQILLNPNGGTAALTLGTLTATAAGSALLMGQTASSGTATITTTSPTVGNGIYGGRVVYTSDGGTTVDWATTASTGSPYTLSGLAGGNYTTLPTSGGSSSVNYSMTTGTSLGGGFSVNTLKLDNPSGDLALGGNTLTFSGSGLMCSGSTAVTITGTAGGTRLTTASNGDLIIHQYNTGGLTIGAVIGNTGTTTLTKTGSQKLTLSGANTHSGGTYLNAGSLNLANQLALQSSAVYMNGGTLTFDSSVSGNAFTLGGLSSANAGPGYNIALTNTAGVAITLTHKGGSCYGVFSGSGSLVIAGGVNLYGVHTYTGSTTINSGATLNLGGARCYAAIPNSSSILNNGTLRLQHGSTPLVQGIDFASNISGSGNLSIAGSVVILRGANTFSGGVLIDQNNDGCLFLNHDNALGSGTITIANNDYFGSVDTTPHTLANNISFTGSSFIFGKGGKTFGGTGDLTFTGNVGLGGSVRSLTVWDTTTVTFSGIASGTGGGITKAGSGVLALAGGSTGNTYTGGATVSAGTLTFLKKIGQPSSGTTTVASGAALGLGVGGTGYFSTADVDSLWANPCTLALITMNSASLVGIDTSAGDVTYGTSQSTRGLVKLGTNTLTITGTHTYAGATTVIGGTLLVNGSTASGSAVAVRYSGALGGTGTINGSVTVDAGGALRVGSGGGTLTLANSTAPAFAAFSKLMVFATAGTLDKIALIHATPVFTCSNIDLVIDTTGLGGDIIGATIVQTAKGNGGISGTFHSITVNNGATVTPHYNTASGTITLDIKTLKPKGTLIMLF